MSSETIKHTSVFMYSVRYFRPISTKLEFLDMFLKKSPIWTEIRPVGAALTDVDRRTNWHGKAKRCFSRVCKRV